MTGQALIRLRVVGPPDGDRLRIAVGSYGHFGTSPQEHDRIAHEANRAAVLVNHAPQTQRHLLQRLADASPNRELLFPFAVRLENFLSATADLDDTSAAALSDDALLALWENADPAGDGNSLRGET
jgi:hypothetical protein